jgi:[acyl-carrier-protein] S-malonyltransferase
MVSLIGADAASAEALCIQARGDGVLTPANYNCPGQIVIAGTRDACARASAIAEQFGCRAIPLPVAGAFHSPLMASAANALRPKLAETRFSVPRIPVIANVDAEYHRDAAGIRHSLSEQVTQPVLWQRCIERLIEDGVDHFVEMGPGRVLTGLMRKINRKIATSNVSNAESITAHLAVSAVA